MISYDDYKIATERAIYHYECGWSTVNTPGTHAVFIMTSWHRNAFLITGPVWGESSGHLTKDQWRRAFMLPLMSAWKIVVQTLEWSVIWDAMTLMCFRWVGFCNPLISMLLAGSASHQLTRWRSMSSWPTVSRWHKNSGISRTIGCNWSQTD